MQKMPYVDLISLRFLVGYLGEKATPPWWKSSFFAPGSSMFLNPIFPKTAALAKYHGIKEAACRIHDERIGTGMGVFHLFRLPDALEREMHSVLNSAKEPEQFVTGLENSLEAITILKKWAEDETLEAVGPIRIGNRSAIGKREILKTIAGYYYHAFLTEQETFPYFSGEKASEKKAWKGPKNVEAEVEGDELIIKVDLTKTYGMSSSGKSLVIATTEGNQSVPGRENVKFGLNIYTRARS